MVAVATSGGPDSTALLHCTARAARRLGLGVLALHVHHGLQAGADQWVRHLRRQVSRWQCEGLPVALRVHRLEERPARGESIEAWARRCRYAALAAMARDEGCGLVLLAHHRRDQAETFLLQALRGGGAAGLAAMPARVEREGLIWCRPWLAWPRRALESYAHEHRLRAVLDPSNDDPRHARSRLRGVPWRALETAFPEIEIALAAAARRAAVEATALREWADELLSAWSAEASLPVAPWLSLPPARREVVLRCWLKRAGSAVPEALVRRLLAEVPRSTAASWPEDAHLRWRLYRGALRREPVPTRVEPAGEGGPAPVPDWPCDLSRVGEHRAPAWHGVLRVQVATGAGIAAAALRQCVLRARHGGDRFQLAPNRPARSLKKQFQALGLGAGQRDGPIVACGESIVYVPGLGVDARWQAQHGQDGGDGGGGLVVSLHWLPDALERAGPQGLPG